MPYTFSPLLRVSDTDMHHGTCVTHVPWCISGSLTGGFLWSQWRGKRSRHYRRMRTRNFTYLVRGLWEWNVPTWVSIYVMHETISHSSGTGWAYSELYLVSASKVCITWIGDNEQLYSHGCVQDCDISSVLILDILILQKVTDMTNFTYTKDVELSVTQPSLNVNVGLTNSVLARPVKKLLVWHRIFKELAVHMLVIAWCWLGDLWSW